MKKEPCILSPWRTMAAAVAVCASVGIPGASRAVLGSTPPDASLVVAPLRDAGGLMGEEQMGLPGRLSQAFGKYLSRVASGQFQVVPSSREMTGETGDSRHYVLEGALSRLQTGSPLGEGYLCVVRLLEVGNLRLLIGHWAATANTMRDLTGNLTCDPRVDPQGLVGELGRRVADAVVSSTSGQGVDIAALVRESAHSAEPDVRVLADLSADSPRDGELLSGAPYRLSVFADHAGSVFILALDADGSATPLYLQDPGHEVNLDARTAALLPAGDALVAPVTTTTLHLRILVLVRHKDAGVMPRAIVAWSRSLPAAGNPDNTQPASSPAAVRVLDPAAALAAGGDQRVADLLKSAAADPPGSWNARVIDLVVVGRPVP